MYTCSSVSIWFVSLIFFPSSVISSENVISTIQQTKHHFCRFFALTLVFIGFHCCCCCCIRLYIKHFTPQANRIDRADRPRMHTHTHSQTHSDRQTRLSVFLRLLPFCCCYYKSNNTKKKKGKKRRNGKELFQIGSKHLDLLPKMYYIY